MGGKVADTVHHHAECPSWRTLQRRENLRILRMAFLALSNLPRSKGINERKDGMALSHVAANGLNPLLCGL